MWYSMFALAWPGSERVNAPSWLGAIVSGPVRKNRYSRPIWILPNGEWVHSLRVFTPLTLKAVRSCRWSCRFSPTPGASWTTGMPCCFSSAAGPIPEHCMICGEPMAPAVSTVSIRAEANCDSPPRENSTPTTRLPSIRRRLTSACVTTFRLGRFITGRRNALVAFQRTPRFWLTSKKPLPSLSPRL